MIRTKASLARGVGRLSRATGRGGGTTLPGRLLLKLDPDAISKLGGSLEHGSTLISATNGKTTTASMLATIFNSVGRSPIHNRAGSNMTWGVATALLEQKGDEGLFEVDEAWLPEVASRLRPRTILLGNLFRDQLDRYGETEALADAWAEMAASLGDDTAFVLNADDPMIADIARYSGTRTMTFGIDDPSRAVAELQHARDAKQCRICGGDLVYEFAFVGHLGHYSCPACGLVRPTPDVSATEIRLLGMDGIEATITAGVQSARLKLPLPGLYNLYNAVAAIATAHSQGISLAEATSALSSMKAVFGRVERIQVGPAELSILLVKNPAGANEVLRTLELEPGDLTLWIALNDRIADGRDVSWIWDADFEILAGRVGSVVCTGTRASEMALRLKYAGWPEDQLTVVRDLGRSIETVMESQPEKVFALPTYTALLELRGLLADNRSADHYWKA
jgi:UDP-N-acetylmuramyl tripeptide synthase